MHPQTNGVSGHVFIVKRKRGDQWYAKYRLPSGRQIQKRLGPASTGRGRIPDGHLTKRIADARLAEILTDARRGEILDPGDRTGGTFREACDEWLRYVEDERERRPSTVRDYRNTVEHHLVPEFGAEAALGSITTETIDTYRRRLLAEGHLSRRSVQKVLVLLHGILKLAKRRKWITTNPAEDAERVSVKRSGDFSVLTPEQVFAVARAATTEQDAAIFITAAFTGLRMGELRALRWIDVGFAAQTVFVRASFTNGSEVAGPPKSGKIRSVPLIEQAVVALDTLSRRELFTEPGDLVFPALTGGFLDDSKLRKDFYAALQAAGLGHLRDLAEPFRFHDLRHTFGTLGAAVWPLHDLQGYMGHASIQTTMIYVHHVPKSAAAAELSRAVTAAVAPPDGTTHRMPESLSRRVPNLG